MAQHLTLRDGRNLDFAVDGADDGYPLIWLHGTPGSYKATPPSLVRASKKNGFKVISMSRAGYGGSSRHIGRTVIDGVADVEALKRHLGITKCVVGGWSGGGPHVLACAARLSGCIGTLCVAGVGPYGVEDLNFMEGQGQDNIDEFNATLEGEEALRKYLDAARPGLVGASAADIVREMSSILPESDKKALMDNDEVGQNVVDGFGEALRLGVDGWLDDDMEMMQGWGFELSEIKVPVIIYQGSEDKMVPFAHGEWLAKHLPQQHLRKYLLEGEGHISIFLDRVEKMVEELLEIVKAQ